MGWTIVLMLACGDKGQDTAGIDTGDSGEQLVLSNDGPDGEAITENSCAPNDGWALDVIIGMDESVCTEERPDDFWVRLTVFPDDFESGQEIPLGITAETKGFGFFHHGGQIENAVDGSAKLIFDGDWGEGSVYTGSYWVELESGLIIEGSFDGLHCGGQPMCG